MRILLLDSTQHYPANPLFAEALEELARDRGRAYRMVDEARWLRPLQHSLVGRVAYRMLGPLAFLGLNAALMRGAIEFYPDIVLVVKGTHLSPAALRRIKERTGAYLINYATDDPFNARNSSRWLRSAIPLYDLYACTKRAIMDDVRQAGARDVTYVPFGYKPSVHFPESPATDQERRQFACDVVFIGGCDDDRVPYLRELVSRCPDLRVRLYGGDWDRELELRKCHGGVVLGRDYRLALGGSRIALNLVRRANRDGHVMRSFEVPACGAFMLADRTEEHKALFAEDREVAYFGSPGELAEKVRYYLPRESDREPMRRAAYEKVTKGGHTYRDRLESILRMADVGPRTWALGGRVAKLRPAEVSG